MMRGYFAGARQGLCYGLFNSPWMMIGGALVFIAIVTLVVVLIVRAKKHRESNSDGSLALLKSKFVSGEISEEEYLKKKEILKH
ncbi:MAG: SHOCT domain-containing protein [Christensenellales bacterium]